MPEREIVVVEFPNKEFQKVMEVSAWLHLIGKDPIEHKVYRKDSKRPLRQKDVVSWGEEVEIEASD